VIFRGTSVDDLEELYQTQGETSYTDATVLNGVTYYYAVTATNEAGQGTTSGHVVVTPFRPASVPGSVRGLSTVVDKGIVTLSWTPPDDDGGSAITGYIILRGETADGLDALVTIGLNTSWTDEDVSRGRTYFYSVVAVNDVGQGELTTAVEIKVPKKKDEGPGPDAVAAVVALSVVALIFVAGRRGRMGPFRSRKVDIPGTPR
jgi:hypothetical protein